MEQINNTTNSTATPDLTVVDAEFNNLINQLQKRGDKKSIAEAESWKIWYSEMRELILSTKDPWACEKKKLKTLSYLLKVNYKLKDEEDSEFLTETSRLLDDLEDMKEYDDEDSLSDQPESNDTEMEILDLWPFYRLPEDFIANISKLPSLLRGFVEGLLFTVYMIIALLPLSFFLLIFPSDLEKWAALMGLIVFAYFMLRPIWDKKKDKS